MSPEVSALAAGWGHGNTLANKGVPVVPNVPAQNQARSRLLRTVCLHDVLERAAILEYGEGLPRQDAEALALAALGWTTHSEST